MPFSFRPDDKTAAKIRRLAAAMGRSRSDIVREAVAEYTVDVDGAPAGRSAYDRLRPFIGVVSTAGANLSRDTHEKYRTLLRRRHRARRSR